MKHWRILQRKAPEYSGITSSFFNAKLIEPVLTIILQGVTSIKDTTSFESQIFHQLEYPWCMQILVFGPKEHRKGGLFDSYFPSLEMPLPFLRSKIDGTQIDSFISCSPLKISMIGCP